MGVSPAGSDESRSGDGRRMHLVMGALCGPILIDLSYDNVGRELRVRRLPRWGVVPGAQGRRGLGRHIWEDMPGREGLGRWLGLCLGLWWCECP